MRVLGLQRPLFVALVAAAALYCLVRSGAWLRFGLALVVGEWLSLVVLGLGCAGSMLQSF